MPCYCSNIGVWQLSFFLLLILLAYSYTRSRDNVFSQLDWEAKSLVSICFTRYSCGWATCVRAARLPQEHLPSGELQEMSLFWKRLVQSTLLHAFCWRDWGRSLLLAAPRLVALILQWCAEMAGLSCAAPWRFPSSAGIHQQFPSPRAGTEPKSWNLVHGHHTC